MHFNVNRNHSGNTPLSGLAFVEYLAAGAKLLGAAKGGGGGAGAPGVMVSTATNVNTQVSPQISPVFVQQSDPSNSPVNAGIGMGTPVTGAMPGFDNLPRNIQPLQAGISPLAIAGIGAALLIFLAMRKKAN
jgi:hypothetical protein